MNIIIDTHTFLWALADQVRLIDEKRSALEDLSNTIYVSAVSITELMIKAFIGKLQIDFDPVAKAKGSGSALLDLSADAALLQPNEYLIFKMRPFLKRPQLRLIESRNSCTISTSTPSFISLTGRLILFPLCSTKIS